jgi:hypothetical protein
LALQVGIYSFKPAFPILKILKIRIFPILGRPASRLELITSSKLAQSASEGLWLESKPPNSGDAFSTLYALKSRRQLAL